MIFFKTLRDFLREYVRVVFAGGVFDRIFVGACALIFVSQVALLAGFVFQAVGTQAVIGAIDNDAGAAIDTALRTEFYNNNGFSAYGPTYYRAVRWIELFYPGKWLGIGESREANEQLHHFLLMLVSLLALSGTALLISSLLTPSWPYRFLAGGTLLSVFVSNGVWIEMVFRAHPDHLLGLAVGLATWLTVRSYLRPEFDQRFYAATAAWGVVASVKMTVILFAPAMILFFLNQPKAVTRSVFIKKRMVGIVGGALTSYLVIGFPQSFDFLPVIRFMLQQQRNVKPGDLTSLWEWLQLFWSQFWVPFAVIILFAAMLGFVASYDEKDKVNEREILSPSKLLIALLVFLWPLIWLMSRRVTSAFYWYPIPFVVCLLVVLAMNFENLVRLAVKRWMHPRIRAIPRVATVPLVFFLATPSFWAALPASVPQVLATQLKCRAEAYEVEKRVNAAAELGEIILADPYIPYARKFHDKQVKMTWEMNWNRVVRGETKMIALKKDYYLMYISKNEGGFGSVVDHLSDPSATERFYKSFLDQASVVDPTGQTWLKAYTDSCSFELWTRQD